MTQLFDYPEIVYLVCEQTPRSDLARLLTTSRLFFDCAVPLVWRKLPGAAPAILLRLLPDSDVHMKHFLKPRSINRVQSLDAQSLVRFNLYAPYVKQLARGLGSDRIWKKLFKLVGARPILPNLEVLRISISSWTPDTLPHIAICLTPTLSRIYYGLGAESSTGPQRFLDLVSTIGQQCPNIRTLKLGYVTRGFTVGPNYANGLAASLGQFNNLRVLGLGLVMLHPTMLTTLGSVPNLESLFLNEKPDTCTLPWDPIPEDQWICIANSLSHDSFPRLKRLEIDPCFDIGLATRLWNIAPLVGRLTSICIRTGMHKLITETQFHDFIHNVCRSSPFTSTLSLTLPGWMTRVALLSPEIINHLAQLPLQQLRLIRDYYYDIDAGTSPRFNSEHFSIAFPRMEYLHIWGYFFQFKDLVFIARHMPLLRQLSVKVTIDKDWPSRDELSSLALTPSPSRLYFHLNMVHGVSRIRPLTLIYDELPKDAVEAIAGGLHGLWPKGVTCVIDVPPGRDGGAQCADQINAALRWLHEADGHGDWVEIMPLKNTPPPWLEGLYLA